MEIRGTEVLLPVSAVSAFPRPHWLQGRILGSLSEPVYRSQNLRVAYEDACKICAHEQEKDLLAPADFRERGHDHAERDRQAVQGRFPRPRPAERHRQGRALWRPEGGG